MRISLLDAARLRAVHCVARAALRFTSPARALRIVGRVASISPPLRDLPEARAAEALLARSGSCLTRAVTVASRLAGSEVVIGADPWRAGSGSPHAHAWVELGGQRLDPASGREFLFGELARLRVP
jgi:hypothetical protein